MEFCRLLREIEVWEEHFTSEIKCKDHTGVAWAITEFYVLVFPFALSKDLLWPFAQSSRYI